MDCRACGGSRTTKNGHTPKGNQRYMCHECHKTFVEVFDPRWPASTILAA
jgi:transposase-like protein